MKVTVLVASVGYLLMAACVGSAATIAVPFDQPTIQSAIDIVSDFDTVLVSNGTYTENIDFLGKAVTLLSEGGRDVTFIEAADPYVTIVSFVNYEDSNSIIDGFTIRHTTNAYGIACWRAHPIIRNCDISFCYRTGDGAGIFCDLSAAKIRHNRIHDNHGTLTGGGVLATGTHADWLEVFANEIYFNSSANGPGVACGTTSRRISVQRNAIWGNVGTGALGGAVYTSGQDIKIINNTVTANSKGIMVYQQINLDIRNNIVTTNVGEGLSPGTGTYDYNDVWNNGSYNNPGPNGISLDPMFLDSTNHIYVLHSESPCIDAGDPDPQYNEPDGSRNDIGAYPFVAGGPVAVNINYGPDAVGNLIYIGDPEIYWSYFDAVPTVQNMYEIEVGTDTLWDVAEKWTTGQVVSADTHVTYAGSPLQDHKRYYLRIRLHNGDHWGDWSKSDFFIHWSSLIEIPGDYPTIQEGISVAIAEDTVLVSDGHYYERISLPIRSIVIASEFILDGDSLHIANTIIDGDTTVLGPADSGSVVSAFTSPPWDVSIKLCGFGIQSGLTQNAIGIYRGSHDMTVQNCRITSNDSISYLSGTSHITFDSCRIENNNAGSVLSSETSEGYEFLNCTISGMTVNVPCPCELRNSILQDCTIEWILDRPDRGIFGSELSGCSVKVAIDASAVIDSSSLYETDLVLENSSCDISRSIVKGHATLHGSLLPVLTVTNCTFIGDIELENAGDLSLVNTIVNPAGAHAVGSNSASSIISAACCDMYGFDSIWLEGTYQQLDTSDVLFLDPLFCDPDSSDYQLYNISPCLPESNGCGVLIGACSVGCDIGLPYARDINFGSESPDNIVNHVPTIYWTYDCVLFETQEQFEIAVGTDDDWEYAEMWNPPPNVTPDTFVVYGGSALVDGETYWLRLRVHSSVVWSDWAQISFRMNSVPSVPSPYSPVGDQLVGTKTPDLTTANSSDPEGDSLYYVFELSSDSFQTVDYTAPVTEDEGGFTSWTVESPLDEDQRYWWRARAADYYEQTTPSYPATFFVDSENTLPTAFDLVYPPDTASSPVESLKPEFVWAPSYDTDPFDSVVFSLLLSIDSNFTFVNTVSGITTTSYVFADSFDWGDRFWWKVKAEDKHSGVTWSNQALGFRIVTLGDADGSGEIDIDDVVFTIEYIFMGGPAPVPLFAADADCNGEIDIDDCVYLIEYAFIGGPAPCAEFP